MPEEAMAYVSVAAAANILRVSKQRIYQLLDAGALAGKRSGDTRLVGIQSVKARIQAIDDRKHMRLEI